MADIERLIDIPGLPTTRSWAYANAVVAGGFVFLAGQAGTDSEGRLVSPEFVPQAQQAFENIRIALEGAGASLSDIVTMTVFLTDWRYGVDFCRVRGDVLGDNLAASATIGIGHLAEPGMLVEVQCTAIANR